MVHPRGALTQRAGLRSGAQRIGSLLVPFGWDVNGLRPGVKGGGAKEEQRTDACCAPALETPPLAAIKASLR